MEKERNVRNFVIVGLVMVVICMSAAFAAMTTRWEISGTVNLPNAEWDVGFTSAVAKTGTEYVGSDPSINTTNNTVTYTVNLQENTTYEFDAEISNNGTYDALLKTFTVAGLPEALEEIVTYTVTGVTQGSTVIQAKNGETPGKATVNVKITMGAIDDEEKLAAVKANSSLTLTVIAEFEQQ